MGRVGGWQRAGWARCVTPPWLTGAGLVTLGARHQRGLDSLSQSHPEPCQRPLNSCRPRDRKGLFWQCWVRLAEVWWLGRCWGGATDQHCVFLVAVLEPPLKAKSDCMGHHSAVSLAGKGTPLQGAQGPTEGGGINYRAPGCWGGQIQPPGRPGRPAV